MNPRENLISLYRGTGFRYPPVQLNLCPALQEKYRELAGDTALEEYFAYPEGFAIDVVPGVSIDQGEGADWIRFYPPGLREGTVFDDFGVAYEPGSEASFHMKRMRHPLASFNSLEQMQAYPFPRYNTRDIRHIIRAVRTLHREGKAAVARMQCSIWETAWYLRDMAQLMLDMAMEDEKAVFLLDKITDLSCRRAASFARAGVDIIELGDDIGMQQSLMMSREMYRTWLKPRLARVVAAAKKEKPDVLIFYHTCGFVEPLIEDLIQAGVEILNPVQPECMDFAALHAKYGDRLSFNGTLGTQSTMPFGAPREVKEVVFRNLEIAGARGGLLCCPTHILEPEVPWENIEAYVEACREFNAAGA